MAFGDAYTNIFSELRSGHDDAVQTNRTCIGDLLTVADAAANAAVEVRPLSGWKLVFFI